MIDEERQSQLCEILSVCTFSLLSYLEYEMFRQVVRYHAGDTVGVMFVELEFLHFLIDFLTNSQIILNI